MSTTNNTIPSEKPAPRRAGPILASIGTVLIDVFETTPLLTPTISFITPTNPTFSSPDAPQSHPVVPPVPTFDLLPPLEFPISNTALLTTPESSTSGTSTPQLPFDSSQTLSSTPSHELLGGGALYNLVGARIWLLPSELRTLVDRAPGGTDLSAKFEENLNSFGPEMWVWNEFEGSRMTRSRIAYENGSRRYEQIVQPPCRTIESLINTPLANAEFLHVSPPFSPEDLFKLQSGLRQGGDGGWRPKIVFEPTPGSCHPGQQEWLEKIAPGVEVLSYASLDIAGSGVDKFRPNHEELLSFYSCEQYPLCSPEFRPTLERLTHRLLDKMAAGGNEGGIIAVRCGRMGSSVGTRSGGVKWFPACFGAEDERLVKDVTGAGNAYLGGYVAGLSLSGGDPYEAALYATVSASFAVEQLGLPVLSTENFDSSEGLWNDDRPKRRLDELRERVKCEAIRG